MADGSTSASTPAPGWTLNRRHIIGGGVFVVGLVATITLIAVLSSPGKKLESATDEVDWDYVTDASGHVNLAPCYSFCYSRQADFCTNVEGTPDPVFDLSVKSAADKSKVYAEGDTDSWTDPFSVSGKHRAVFCREWCLAGCALYVVRNESCVQYASDKCSKSETRIDRSFACLVAKSTGCSVGSTGDRQARHTERGASKNTRFASGECPVRCFKRGKDFCVSTMSPEWAESKEDRRGRALAAIKKPTSPASDADTTTTVDVADDGYLGFATQALGNMAVDIAGNASACDDICVLGCGLGYLYGPRCPERCEQACRMWAVGPWQTFSCIDACSTGCTDSGFEFYDGLPESGFIR